MSKQQAPFVVRWRNGVMDDSNPVLSWRALAAAMALTRYADVKTGHNCFPGAPKCARIMRVSVDTIQRGWGELEAAGWLEMRSRGEGVTGLASLKILRWPAKEPTAHSGTADSGLPPTAAHPTADSGSTFPGNQGGLSTPAEAVEAGKPGVEAGQENTAPGEPKQRREPARSHCLRHPGSEAVTVWRRGNPFVGCSTCEAEHATA